MILGIVGDEVVELTGHQTFTENKVETILKRGLKKDLYGVVTLGNMGVETIVQRKCAELNIKHFALHTLTEPTVIFDFIDYLTIIRGVLPHRRLDELQNKSCLPTMIVTLDGKEEWKNL